MKGSNVRVGLETAKKKENGGKSDSDKEEKKESLEKIDLLQKAYIDCLTIRHT